MVIPEFYEVHSLDVGPLSDLSNSTLGINDLEEYSSGPWDTSS